VGTVAEQVTRPMNHRASGARVERSWRKTGDRRTRRPLPSYPSRQAGTADRHRPERGDQMTGEQHPRAAARGTPGAQGGECGARRGGGTRRPWPTDPLVCGSLSGSFERDCCRPPSIGATFAQFRGWLTDMTTVTGAAFADSLRHAFHFDRGIHREGEGAQHERPRS
jgi:hypothetical protein